MDLYPLAFAKLLFSFPLAKRGLRDDQDPKMGCPKLPNCSLGYALAERKIARKDNNRLVLFLGKLDHLLKMKWGSILKYQAFLCWTLVKCIE